MLRTISCGLVFSARVGSRISAPCSTLTILRAVGQLVAKITCGVMCSECDVSMARPSIFVRRRTFSPKITKDGKLIVKWAISKTCTLWSQLRQVVAKGFVLSENSRRWASGAAILCRSTCQSRTWSTDTSTICVCMFWWLQWTPCESICSKMAW